mmetsp:Transcript_23551/g.31226  ORF Transcript_23551/g.31226 Transcript_23551/m.31226 type:complete len:214 (+) Transcript_23551:607-1248(+)
MTLLAMAFAAAMVRGRTKSCRVERHWLKVVHLAQVNQQSLRLNLVQLLYQRQILPTNLQTHPLASQQILQLVTRQMLLLIRQPLVQQISHQMPPLVSQQMLQLITRQMHPLLSQQILLLIHQLSHLLIRQQLPLPFNLQMLLLPHLLLHPQASQIPLPTLSLRILPRRSLQILPHRSLQILPRRSLHMLPQRSLHMLPRRSLHMSPLQHPRLH